MPINAFAAGVAALAINSTAFTIEIFRGGFAAVPVAQHDAARALGLRPALIMALVVVPQVFRIVLPPLGSQIVSVVLGSAQASIIGVPELTYQTQSIGSSTFRYFELFTIAALFYIALEQDATVDEGELIAEIMEAAANFRAVLTERTPEARRVLQSLLPDRLQFSAFEREGA